MGSTKCLALVFPVAVQENSEGAGSKLGACPWFSWFSKRRTSVAGLFPNGASALRLVSAVVMEISEEWETGKVYLSMDLKAQESD